MKNFISENLNSMTLTFTLIVILNTIIRVLFNIQWGNVNIFVIVLASFVFLLSLWSHFISFFNFQSEKAYHLINVSSQLVLFFILSSAINFMPLTFENILINGVIYISLYFVNVKYRHAQFKQLTNEINKRLSH